MGKGRHWLVIKGEDDANTLFDKLRDVANGVIVAAFDDGPMALVHKKYDSIINVEGLTLHSAVTQGRLAKNKVKEIFTTFWESGVVGNMRFKVETTDKLPDWHETIKQLAQLSEEEVTAFLANALNKVKELKRTKGKSEPVTPLEQSALNMEKHVAPYIKKLKESHALLFSVSDGPYRFPQDYLPGVLDMIGTYWDHFKQCLATITLRQAVMESDIYKRRSLFFTGKSGRGKTKMLEALARRLCLGHGFQYYVSGTMLDPIGVLTLSGKINKCGAVVMSDFEMRTLQDKPLPREGIKNLIKAEEQGGGFPARYHAGVIPSGTPRLFSVNSDIFPTGHKKAGEVNWAHWFEQQLFCEALTAIVNEDMGFLGKMGGNDEAIARGAIIFKVPEYLFKIPDGQEKPRDKIHEDYLRRLQREKELGL